MRIPALATLFLLIIPIPATARTPGLPARTHADASLIQGIELLLTGQRGPASPPREAARLMVQAVWRAGKPG